MEDLEEPAFTGFHLTNPPGGAPRLRFRMLAGRQKEVQAAGDGRSEEARRHRQLSRPETAWPLKLQWLYQVKRKQALRGRNHVEG